MSKYYRFILLTFLMLAVALAPACKDNPEAPEPFAIWVTPVDTTVAVGEIVTFVVHHSGEWPKYSHVVYDFGDGTEPGMTTGKERQYAYNLPGSYQIHIRVIDHEDGTEFGHTSASVQVGGSPGILEFTRDTVVVGNNERVTLVAVYTGPKVYSAPLNCEFAEYYWYVAGWYRQPDIVAMHTDTATFDWSHNPCIAGPAVVSLVARDQVLCSDTCVVIIR